MKRSTKLLSILLALALVLSLGVTAFADTSSTTEATGTITITNATIGQTYTVYKLFDATYGETETDSDGDEVTPTAYIATEEQYKALSEDEDCVFDFAAIYDEDGDLAGYQVTVTSGASEEEVISYIKELIFSVNGFPGYEKVESKEAESDTVTFEGLDFGYYFVTSSLGATVSIDTVNPTAAIEDKNSDEPTLDNDTPSDEKDVVNAAGDSIDGTVVNVGDVLTYVISYTNTGYYTEAEDGTLASVVIVDAAPEGTELAKNDGTEDAEDYETVGNPGYTVTDGDDKEVTLTDDDGDGIYTGTVTVEDEDGEETSYTITATYELSTSEEAESEDTITWTFTGVPKDYTVTATFEVTVLESALDNTQNRIDNTADIDINNTFTLTTNQVTNYVPDPSDPSKDVKSVTAETDEDTGETTETVGEDSYNTEQTDVGEVLQYEITYTNTEEEEGTGQAQKVEIQDAAPTGTSYIKGSAAITIQDADGNEVEVSSEGTFTVNGTTSTVSVAIASDGTITWTVDTLPVGYTVVAAFRVTVTEAAYGITDLTIRNTADVYVDNSYILTNEVENPVPEDEDNPKDPDPGKVIVASDGTETQVSTGSFGETVTFDLGINAVNKVTVYRDADGNVVSRDDYDAETGTAEIEQVTEYYIYDQMDPGFDLDELTTLTINGKEYTITASETTSTGYVAVSGVTEEDFNDETYYVYSDGTYTAATSYDADAEYYIATTVTTWQAKDDNGNVVATFYTAVDSNGYTIINGIVSWATSETDSETNETTWTSLYPDCQIHLTYTATINEDAEIAGDGNVNRFMFSYNTVSGSGDDDEPDPENPDYPDGEDLVNGSEERTTVTYTYALAIQKISSETGEALAGAIFTATDNYGSAVYGIAVTDSDGETLYYNYTSDSTAEGATCEFVTNSDGQIIIKGVDVGTYTFTETEAPAGYALLTDSVDVEATMTSSTTTVTTTVTETARYFTAITEDEWDDYTGTVYVKTEDEDGNTVFELAEKPEAYSSETTYYKLVSSSTESANSGNIVTTNTFSVSSTVLAVLNTPGSELPSTGGMGTTLLYTVGIILVLGAGILLVVRRRMGAGE